MQPVILRAAGDCSLPCFTEAQLLPERGLMISRLTVDMPDTGPFDLIADQPRADDDFAGNASFSFGGAFLAPYASRITGRPGPGRTIETEIAGRTVRLPANWSGKAPGSAPYAMHGLILDKQVEVTDFTESGIKGRLLAGDFGVGWPSLTELTFAITLHAKVLAIAIIATNYGDERMPIGIGWHPYFRLPSGDRAPARLTIPAEHRLEVGDYDAVLPTGHKLALVGTPYDFADPEGRALGDLYLDDCFVDLHPHAEAVATFSDPSRGFSMQISAEPPVSAVQVYAPPDKAFAAIEPQFNWADPFGAVWPQAADTRMVWLEPGEQARYAVNVTLSD